MFTTRDVGIDVEVIGTGNKRICDSYILQQKDKNTSHTRAKARSKVLTRRLARSMVGARGQYEMVVDSPLNYDLKTQYFVARRHPPEMAHEFSYILQSFSSQLCMEVAAFGQIPSHSVELDQPTSADCGYIMTCHIEQDLGICFWNQR
ncbi:hypothetical protein NC651_015789 [Populus alba x Populus x berolinensis]|nr:hypothetical protein NC651_015789 [Populus alba x Populus x berolinensis]